MEDNGTVINSTKIQLNEFKESLVWADIAAELNEWKKGFEVERAFIVDNAKDDNPSTASVLLHMGDINGRLKTIEYIKSLPDMFLDILKLKAEEKESRKED